MIAVLAADATTNKPSTQHFLPNVWRVIALIQWAGFIILSFFTCISLTPSPIFQKTLSLLAVIPHMPHTR
jgi:hypothetical protein